MEQKLVQIERIGERIPRLESIESIQECSHIGASAYGSADELITFQFVKVLQHVQVHGRGLAHHDPPPVIKQVRRSKLNGDRCLRQQRRGSNRRNRCDSVVIVAGKNAVQSLRNTSQHLADRVATIALGDQEYRSFRPRRRPSPSGSLRRHLPPPCRVRPERLVADLNPSPQTLFWHRRGDLESASQDVLGTAWPRGNLRRTGWSDRSPRQ